MKRTISLLATALVLMATTTFAQTTLKEYKAGHVFYVSLPDYMTKTTGINAAAVIQFKNEIKDIAGFIIEDNKEELAIAGMSFSSINDFYENFIKDFLIDKDKRKVSPPVMQTIGKTNFINCDASYYDAESKMEIYYFVGFAETNDAFYKVLCFGSMEGKTKFKADFQKILKSIRD
jgi:hypothetical protein